MDQFIFNNSLKWIPFNKFENFEYLDEGGFGIVYKAILKNKSKEIVLKFNKLNNFDENLNEFLNEVW